MGTSPGVNGTEYAQFLLVLLVYLAGFGFYEPVWPQFGRPHRYHCAKYISVFSSLFSVNSSVLAR